MIVADEIASGIGRTYWPLASHVVGVPHDILVLGKGLANGLLPVSCVVVSQEMLSRLSDKGTDFGHTHSNHLGAAGAVESTLTALSEIDHERFSADLELMMNELPCKTFTEGATGVIILGSTTPRPLVDEICRNEGVVLHLPTVTSALDRLIVAPPLTTNHDDIIELGCRLKRVTNRIEAEL